MIGRTNAGGGGGGSSVSLIILGAKNETVTYTGPESGSVVLDVNGVGSATLKRGAYVFSGSVSGYVTAALTVDKDTTTIYVRPVGALYWYGVQIALLTPSSGTGPTYEDDHFSWLYPASWSSLATNNNGAGYTSCTMRYWANGTSTTLYLGYGSTNAPSGTQQKVVCPNTNTYTDKTLNFTPDDSGATIRIYGDAYGTRHVEVCEWYLGDR